MEWDSPYNDCWIAIQSSHDREAYATSIPKHYLFLTENYIAIFFMMQQFLIG